jgi:hypothetical protein
MEIVMKTLNLVAVISSVILLSSGVAIAEEVGKHNFSNQQFTGQRPYMKAPVQDSTYHANDQWEGATLVTDVNPDEVSASSAQAKHEPLRLNLLAKRAY